MGKTVVSHIVSDVCRQLGGGGAVNSEAVNIRHVKSINKLVISLQQGRERATRGKHNIIHRLSFRNRSKGGRNDGFLA